MAWLEILTDQQMWTKAKSGISMNKTGARHQACLAWLKANLDGYLVHPKHRETPPIPQPLTPKSPAVIAKLRQYKDGQNSLSLLMELCQGYQWQQPAFEISEHEHGYVCECWSRVGNKDIFGSDIGPSKKNSKA